MTALEKVLQERLEQGVVARNAWERAAVAMEQTLGTAVARKLRLSEHRTAIDAALTKLSEAVQRPTLVIATTGTTSGGKSTIVNYLCGAAVMPSAVQELSAGVVTVEHDESRTRLLIEQTDGALWECGEWTLSVDEIRTRLKAVMDVYRDNRDREGIRPPKFTVGMNTRFGRDPSALGLPPGGKVVLLDLPGLNHMGDRSNGDVIRDQVRSALCLVTYNAANPDKKLQAELLEQVVRQVKTLGGSPARMLFIANRIDEFLKDEDAALESGRFVAQVTTDIRNRVARELPEHADAARALPMHAFSSEPALYALQLASGDEALQSAALARIRKFYVALLPEIVQQALWRPYFSADQRDEVRRILLESSHANAFERALRQHIEKNLPDLLLPHLLADLFDAISEPLSGMEAALRARLAAAHQTLDEEQARLDNAAGHLSQARAELLKLLEPLMVPGLDDKALPLAVSQVEKLNGLKQHALAPLSTWQESLNRAAVDVTTALSKAIEARSEVDSKQLPFVKGSHIAKLSEALRVLQDAGWSGQKQIIELKGEAGSKSSREIVRGLRNLGKALAPVMQDALDAAAAAENDRIYAALEMLLRAQSQRLAGEAERLVPELRALQMPPFAITRIQENLRWDIQFEVDAESNSRTVVEVVDTKKIPRSKRVWWTLWLWEKTWTETKNVYGDVTYHRVELPSASDLCEDLRQQFQDSRPDQKFLDWLHRQLKGFSADLAKFHDDRLRAYRSELNQLRTRVESEQQLKIAQLEVLDGHVRASMQDAAKLRSRG